MRAQGHPKGVEGESTRCVLHRKQEQSIPLDKRTVRVTADTSSWTIPPLLVE